MKKKMHVKMAGAIFLKSLLVCTNYTYKVARSKSAALFPLPPN